METIMENSVARANKSEKGSLMHHGEFVKGILEKNRIPKNEFQQLVGKSHGWMYELLNTEKFNTQQIALVSMALGLDPSEFGYTSPLKTDLSLNYVQNTFNSVSHFNYEIKILVENLNDKYQKIESHIMFLQELLSDASKVVNQQSKMLEKKDEIIYTMLEQNRGN
jgi:hypothetical protein